MGDDQPLRSVKNRKAPIDCLDGQSKVTCQTLKVKVDARRYKRCLIISKPKVVCTNCFMSRADVQDWCFHIVPPNNPYECFAVWIRKFLLDGLGISRNYWTGLGISYWSTVMS